jgi:hypothetical protein
MNYNELPIFMQNHGDSEELLFLAKKIFFKVGQRKFKLDWEQIGDIYI